MQAACKFPIKIKSKGGEIIWIVLFFKIEQYHLGSKGEIYAQVANSAIIFWLCRHGIYWVFWPKIYSILYPSFGNSTINIAIPFIHSCINTNISWGSSSINCCRDGGTIITFNMAARVVEFSNGGTKLESFLSKNLHTQSKLLNFENWISGDLRSFQKSEFYKSIIFILPFIELMNNGILIVFQCEKWFVYHTIWDLLRFFLKFDTNF